MRRAALALALALLVPHASRAADPTAPPGRPLGIGEPREPEVYSLEMRFLDAVRENDRKSVERALARGVAVGSRDDAGRSALLLAARDAGSLELVKLLHARGAALDEPDVGGRTALSWAAANGHLDIVRWLAEQGVPTDRKDAESRTPLYHAVAGEQLDVIEFLLAHGASPNTPDHFGDTPLILACSKGYDALAEMLLRSGADASLRNREGQTAADRAANPNGPCRAGAPLSPR